MQVPQLSKVLGIKKENLPNFYVLHPYTETLEALTEPLDNEKKFSPETILIWAKKIITEIEIELWKKDIELLEEK